MFEAGKYHGKLKAGVVTLTKNKTEQMAITFNITHQDNGGEWVPVEPADRTSYLSFSDGAWEYTQAKLQTLGFNNDLANPQFGQSAIEEGVELLCRHEEYNGKNTEKWELANWGTARERVPDDSLRRLQARWNAKTGHSAKPAVPKAAPRASAPTAPKTAPKAPPKTAASNGSATATVEVADRNTSYTATLEAYKGNRDVTEQQVNDKWFAAIEKVADGRAEDALTAEDWVAVTEEAIIPF